MSLDRKIDARVFLEGVEIPYEEIQISVTGNTYSTCDIRLPPVEELYAIPPRTYVQIWFKDFFSDTGIFEDDFCLLWDGEVAGVGYAEDAATGRAFQLTCYDLSSYWSFVYGFFQAGVTYGFDDVLLAAFGVDPSAASFFRIGTRTFEADIQKILQDSGGAGISKSIDEFLRRALQLNPFLRIRNRQLKMTADTDAQTVKTRVKVLDDPESLALFRTNALDEIFSFAIEETEAAQDLQTVLSRFLDFFFYRSWSIPAPPLLKEEGRTEIVQTILKPATHFSAAPSCNILWPNLFSSVSYRRNYLNEPTRMRIRSMPGSVISKLLLESTVTQFRFDSFAPKILGEILGATVRVPIEAIKDLKQVGQADPNKNVVDATKAAELLLGQIDALPAPQIPAEFADSVLTDTGTERDLELRKGEPSSIPYILILKDGPGVPEESREDLKGVIPAEASLAHYAFLGPLDLKGDQIANYVSRLASYTLSLRQFDRPASGRGPFNPYIIPGFPGILMTKPVPILGEVSSLMHSISSRGAATTMVAFQYARTDDVLRFVHQDELGLDPSEFKKSRTTPDREVPPWINLAYREEFIGQEAFTAREVDIDGSGNVAFGENTERVGAYPALFGGLSSLFRDFPDPENPGKLVNPGAEDDIAEDRRDLYSRHLLYSQKEAARLLLKVYTSRDTDAGKARLAESYMKRPLAKIKDVLEFLGAEIVNEHEFRSVDPESSEAPYRPEIQEIVRAARQVLKSVIRAGVPG